MFSVAQALRVAVAVRRRRREERRRAAVTRETRYKTCRRDLEWLPRRRRCVQNSKPHTPTHPIEALHACVQYLSDSEESSSAEEEEEEGSGEESEEEDDETSSAEDAPVKSKPRLTVAVKASKVKERKREDGDDLHVDTQDSSLLDLDDCKQSVLCVVRCTSLVCAQWFFSALALYNSVVKVIT